MKYLFRQTYLKRTDRFTASIFSVQIHFLEWKIEMKSSLVELRVMVSDKKSQMKRKEIHRIGQDGGE